MVMVGVAKDVGVTLTVMGPSKLFIQGSAADCRTSQVMLCGQTTRST